MNRSSLLWNLAGLVIPLCIAIVAIPELLSRLGQERFGFLGLAWGLIGYASLMDLGMGRAVTQKLSSIREKHDIGEIKTVIFSAVVVTGSLSLIISSMLLLASVTSFAEYIPRDGVPGEEIRISIQIMAITLPLQALSAIYRGVNQAFLNFKGISLVRVFLGVSNFGGPLVVSLYSIELQYLLLTILASRVIGFSAFCIPTRQILKPLGTGPRFNFSISETLSLFRFGGWVALSGVISPFLVQADRYFIGAMISVSAVGSYVVPFEISVQLLVLTGAITTVVFPAISAELSRDYRVGRYRFLLWTRRTTMLMLCVTTVFAIAMPNILNYWIGEDVSPISSWVGRILCVGVFFNAVGSMYYSFLHGQGRSKVTAIFHIVELPIFMLSLWLLIGLYGVVGAAIAWSARMGLDMILMITAVHSFERSSDV